MAVAFAVSDVFAKANVFAAKRLYPAGHDLQKPWLDKSWNFPLVHSRHSPRLEPDDPINLPTAHAIQLSMPALGSGRSR